MTTTTTEIRSVHCLGKHAYGDVWVEINYDGNRLSITGVIGPKANGGARGSCGQIDKYLREDIVAAPGWDRPLIDRLADVWDRWHLNDMRAGTPKQEDFLRRIRPDFPGYPPSYYEWAKERLAEAGLQPDGDYSYGSSWLHEDVPVDVLEFLQSLPTTTKIYPWEKVR